MGLMVLLSGCSGSEPPAPPPEQHNNRTVITLTPVNLFEGEAAKYRLFLGNMSGAFKLSYEGDKPKASLDIDIWRNGKKVEKAGAIGDVFFRPDGSGSREIEVIISIETIAVNGQGEQAVIKAATGSGFATFTIPWDKKLTGRGLIASHEPRTFTAGKAVHVWGMQATSTNEIRTADFSPESMSMLEWAVIFTLRFED
jgi:hypothetical protein